MIGLMQVCLAILPRHVVMLLCLLRRCQIHNGHREVSANVAAPPDTIGINRKHKNIQVTCKIHITLRLVVEGGGADGA